MTRTTFSVLEPPVKTRSQSVQVHMSMLMRTDTTLDQVSETKCRVWCDMRVMCARDVYNCATFRLRCDTIDERGGSTQRHDDVDKCADDLRHAMALEI